MVVNADKTYAKQACLVTYSLVLSGQKIFVDGVEQADFCFCSVRQKEFTVVLVYIFGVLIFPQSYYFGGIVVYLGRMGSSQCKGGHDTDTVY